MLYTKKTSALRALLATTLLATQFSIQSHAATLAQVWQATGMGSAAAQANQAERAEATSKLAQASSFFKPKVTLQGSLGYQDTRQRMQGAKFSAPAFAQMGMGGVENASFSAKAAHGLGLNWQLVATKPVYDPKKRAQQQQIQLGADMANLQHSLKQQQLFMQVANLYYDIALAQEKVVVYQQQFKAVTQAQKEAKYRFKIGDKPITGVHEANEQFAYVQAQLAVAQNELATKKQQLSLVSGLATHTLNAHLPKMYHHGFIGVQPLLNAAQKTNNNLQLQLSAKAIQLAEKKMQEANPKKAYSIALVGKIGQQYSTGNGYGGTGNINQYQHMFGVQAGLPLFTGGYLPASYKTAQLGVVKAQAQNQQHMQEITSQKLTLANQHAAVLEQLQALNAAKKASLARRDATITGKKVGDRTLLNVLQAESSLADIRLKTATAKVNLIKTELAIAQLVNRIDHQLISRLSHSQL